MKTKNTIAIGQIITSAGCRYLIVAESIRKFSYKQINIAGEYIGGGICRAWKTQINGRANAPTYYGRMNFSLTK